MTRDDFVDLFALQVHGAIAGAFVRSNINPSEAHWKMLKGDAPLTMRAIGEIGLLTDTNIHIELRDRCHDNEAGRAFKEACAPRVHPDGPDGDAMFEDGSKA